MSLLTFYLFSQKATIIELKNLLDEEREQRKEDREKAVANLTASIQRVKTEAQEELKRLSDASLRRENEQQEIINKLQVCEWISLMMVLLICVF